MKKAFNIIFALFLLAGCHQAEERLQRLAGNKPPKNAIHEPRYCYKTLGEINCYNSPRKGWEGRLVGHFEPPPVRAAAATPAPKPVKGAAETGVVPEEAIYDLQVKDIASPQAKETSVPAIRPLTR